MELEIFTLCRSTSLYNDKVSLNGIFNTFEFDSLPAEKQSFSVVIRLRLDQSEYGRHKFDFTVLSPSGQKIPPHFSGTFDVSIPHLEFASYTEEFPCAAIDLTNTGIYKVLFNVDNNKIFQLPFIVAKLSSEQISEIASKN